MPALIAATDPEIGSRHFARLETTLELATIIRSTEIVSLDDDFPVDVAFSTVAKGPNRARVGARRWCEKVTSDRAG